MGQQQQQEIEDPVEVTDTEDTITAVVEEEADIIAVTTITTTTSIIVRDLPLESEVGQIIPLLDSSCLLLLLKKIDQPYSSFIMQMKS